jgi:hypothetical protein
MLPSARVQGESEDNGLSFSSNPKPNRKRIIFEVCHLPLYVHFYDCPVSTNLDITRNKIIGYNSLNIGVL